MARHQLAPERERESSSPLEPQTQNPRGFSAGAGCVGDHIIGTRHERFVATWSTSEVDEKEVHPDPGQIADLATGWVLYLQTADAVYTSTLEI